MAEYQRRRKDLEQRDESLAAQERQLQVPVPPAHGTRRGGRLHRGFLREGTRRARRGDLRAKKEAGGATHRPGDRHRRGGGDPVRDPHRSEQRACTFLSFAFRLSPPPTSSAAPRSLCGGMSFCQSTATPLFPTPGRRGSLSQGVQPGASLGFGSREVGLYVGPLGIGEVGLVCSSHAR